MKITKMHVICMIFGVIILGGSLFFLNNLNLFIFLSGIACGIIILPFIIQIVIENKRNNEINDMFLEFSRNLSESVKAGTPVTKSILNLRGRNYGALNPHIAKLANQISVGIPVNKALETFAFDADNSVIIRAITLIREAERAGGEIESILESSAKSIAEIEVLRKERKAAISTLVVQGYIIFFIFIGIMLIMEFKILPLTANLGALNLDLSNLNVENLANVGINQNNPPVIDESNKFEISSFLLLLLAQGFFAGLIIGKLTEGTLKSGMKHSFILVMAAFLISTGSKLIFN